MFKISEIISIYYIILEFKLLMDAYNHTYIKYIHNLKCIDK